MRVAHFDCFSGISGDMTLAALVDAGVDPVAIISGVASLNLPIRIEFERVKRNAIAATYARIEAPEEDVHRHLPEIEAIIERASISPTSKRTALGIFQRLASAEAAVHGTTVDKVHFHEVGALDSIADIVGSAIGMDYLGVERWTSRSVPPGSGMVKCAHGMMPVPAPATAELLKGVPLAAAPVKAELVTPTGAAILTAVVTEWLDQPAMTIERIGCGAGRRDFWEQPNILRLLVGQGMPNCEKTAETDSVWVLETNLDDTTPEIIGFCLERLFAVGALDAFAVPVLMKKNRPGTLLTVIAAEDTIEMIEAVLFAETATFGVRRHRAERSKLQREAIFVDTPWGPVKAKRGWRGHLVIVTPEFEDCARVARENDVPLRDVYRAVQRS